MTKIMTDIRKLAEAFARPTLLFYALPWLMLLLVLGTIAQRYIGLYQSQKIFFGSFVLWVGFFPLPGAYTTLGIIALGLCAKLLLKSPLKKHKAGTLIAHASMLLLLLGGLITAISREEGYMVLGDNDSSHQVLDYHQRELAIIKNGDVVEAIPHGELHIGKVITDPGIPFSITISNYCYQCKATARQNPDISLRGLAAKMDITSAPLDQEDAKNQSGVVFSISGASKEADGSYLSYEALNQQPEFTIGKDKYQVLMRQSERDIPFTIHLLHFDKVEYPGTNVARSYQSQVEVIDGALKWNALIEMNQPLRYRGYTLYQSSFIENDGKLFTVLAVVKNSGALFPYLAVLTLCIGLVIHLIIVFSRKKVL